MTNLENLHKRLVSSRGSESRGRQARHAEAESLKWMNEWKKNLGLQTLH